MGKKKILWVVYDFVQAGGQRYVFEICKALNKEKYQIDFLKVAPMGHDKNWVSEFYYKPTLELGCSIYFWTDLVTQKMELPKSFLYKLNHFFKRKINVIFFKRNTESVLKTSDASLLHDFFSRYDHVNFSGTSVYKALCINQNLHPQNGIIHILTARFQDDTLYDGYDKNLKYNFISPIIKDSLKNELCDFNDYSYSHYPMCFDAEPFEIAMRSNCRSLIIGVFTRLSPMKPLDPYFYALKLLLEQGVDVVLHIYGAGDPFKMGLLRQLQYLYIIDKVKFLGHTESIPDTLKSTQIDLVWFQAGNKQPAGYAAFEISMGGLPQVFWDFMDIGQIHPIEEYFASFSNLTDFVKHTKYLLLSQELLKETGIKQKDYVLKNYSSKNHIHILEDIFDK